MTDYGEVWLTHDESLWDWMWQTRQGEKITEILLAKCLAADTIIEIGCGYGHFCKELLRRGWKGASYLGIDISKGPTTFDGIAANVHAVRGNFMRMSIKKPVDLIVSQAVLCHQAHWLPMTLVALRTAHAIGMDLSYVTDEPMHRSKHRKDGCYDTYVSEAQLQEEIKALHLESSLRVEAFFNKARKANELLLTGSLDPTWCART